MDDIQNVDNKADQVTEECLNNPVVLRRILEHFTNAELLDELSLVNKFWNYEARSVLSKRGDLVARFEHNCDNPWLSYRAFAADLREMNIAPFSGIHMHLRCNYGWPYDCAACPSADLGPTLAAIFNKLTLKQISIRMADVPGNPTRCPGFMLMKKILYHYSNILETLSLSRILNGSSLLLVQGCNFPRLKKLKLESQYWSAPLGRQLCEPFISFLKPMLSQAPNLQVLHSEGDIRPLGELLQGTPIVLIYNEEVSAPFHEIPDSLVGALRLRMMELRYSGPEFNLERFKRITPVMLQSSMTTLRYLNIDVMLAVPLMCYGVCLKNIESFIMWVDYHQLELLEPRLLRIVKDFDFTQTFPGLDKLGVYFDESFDGRRPEHMSQIVDEASAILREPLPHRASNIKQLNVNNVLSSESIQFFAEMFPSITKLQVTTDYGEVPFVSIWKYWKYLEQLEISAEITGNLDSVICGIFPEEVAELEQQDDEYLKRVNIVPVMPAITCLRNLKTFFLVFSRIRSPPFRFSKVTGLIAFKRCPTLTVNLPIYNERIYEALRHMEPYTSLVYRP